MKSLPKKLLVASLLVWAMSFYIYTDYFSPNVKKNDSKTEAHGYQYDRYGYNPWYGYNYSDYSPYQYGYYPNYDYYPTYRYSNDDHKDRQKDCKNRCEDYYDDLKDHCKDSCKYRYTDKDKYDNGYYGNYYNYPRYDKDYGRNMNYGDDVIYQSQHQSQSGGGRQEQHQEQFISL